MDYYSEKTIEKFISFEISDIYIVKWCMNCINSEDFKGEYFFDRYLREVYNRNEALFEDLYSTEEGYRKDFIAAFIALIDPIKHKKKIIWLEGDLKKVIVKVFENCEVRDKDFDSMFVKYIIKKF